MASCTRSSDAEVGFPFFLASTSERRLCHKSVPPHSSPDASPSLSPSLSLRCLVYLQTVEVISSFRCDFSPLQNRVVDVSNDALGAQFALSRSWFRNDMFISNHVKIPLPREHKICRARTAVQGNHYVSLTRTVYDNQKTLILKLASESDPHSTQVETIN